jgi:SAM-dependent methyltransferase
MRATSDVHILDQRTAEERERPFLPGMGRSWLLPFYDVCTRFAGVRVLHERAVEIASIRPGQAVVDVGCGTGSLALAVLAACEDARVIGLDPDAASLRRAARKARRRGLSLTLWQGYADRIPADDASLDRVVSALALHHLDDAGRVGFAFEAFRALRPGGTVTIVDFGGPAPTVDDSGVAPHDHGPAHALRHVRSLIPSLRSQPSSLDRNLGNAVVGLLTDAGFVDAREVHHVDHRFGRVAFVQAIRSQADDAQ